VFVANSKKAGEVNMTLIKNHFEVLPFTALTSSGLAFVSLIEHSVGWADLKCLCRWMKI